MSGIIDFNSSYTFSQYFNFPNPTEEIVAEFGYAYQREILTLPKYLGALDYLNSLKYYLERNSRIINPMVEIAIREFIIAPIVAEVCDHTKAKIYSEYPLIVSEQLKGTLDYFLKTEKSLIIIEAKQSDTKRGFTQLATELIALDKRLENDGSKFLYGVVTSGDDWRFGILQREPKTIYQDTKLYRVPEELETLVRILVGILI